MSAHNTMPEEKALALRLAIFEGCRNALVQIPLDGSIGFAQLCFINKPGGFSVEISDPGPGMMIDGELPPYSRERIGLEYILRQVMGQTVLALIDSPTRIRLRAVNEPESIEHQSRLDLLWGLGKGGYGLLTLCRSWANVIYDHEAGKGTILRLSEPRVIFEEEEKWTQQSSSSPQKSTPDSTR
ncbi:MAG: hypothetical protein NTY46_14025 [Candidatus Sumerlaeota bacterium]|nr:hypothetical protein [Candidatus Sumerlaeota bacterium]